MNKGNKQIAIFLLAISVVTTISAYGMEGEGIAENTVPAQQTCVWYKKRSIQIVAAVTMCSMASYVLAVCMGKVSSPKALWTLLTTSLLAHNNNVQSGNSELNTSADATGYASAKLDDDKINKDDMTARGVRIGSSEANKSQGSIKKFFQKCKDGFSDRINTWNESSDDDID